MQGVVGTKDGGADDLDAAVMWQFFGHEVTKEEDMRA